MVISHILGGLGNQMFQYAAGRAVAFRCQQPYRLDLTGFENYALHQGFEIDRIFSAPVTLATYQDVRAGLGWRSGKVIRKVLGRLNSSLFNGPNLAIEPHFNYWPDLRNRGPSCYLMGYWQSEKYFKDCEDLLRADFNFKLPLDEINLETSMRIQGEQCISLHVRRGDYLTHASTAKILNVCSVDYYRSAIEYMAERIPSPYFFVFSDDLQWAKQNIFVPYPVSYIEGNQGPRSYIDMQLMSLCAHQIIANSTFSWWGAWLNKYPEKIVIAPRHWFNNGMNDSDLIPSNWVRI